MQTLIPYQVIQFFAALGDTCTPRGGAFLGFPTWYKYLSGVETLNGAGMPNTCAPRLLHLADVWLVVAALIEILLRIAGIAAIVFVIYGGIQYMTSRGEPDKTTQARQTILNALIGLCMAIGATILITFVAGRFR
jgi:ABC-type Fe3+ transport system permease subunit